MDLTVLLEASTNPVFNLLFPKLQPGQRRGCGRTLAGDAPHWHLARTHLRDCPAALPPARPLAARC